MSEDSRMRILRFTYDQVLDATKHQDDKINRLLTAIAFLTGGALAVAGLGGAKYLTLRYEFDGREVPLALVAVGVFFLGVVATVLMLVGSLTTPLRLPGTPERKNRSDPGPQPKTKKWASPDAKASPIYFFEVATLSLGQWETKWEPGREEELEDEEFDSLVRETHNLSVRTAFKYKLTTEAVAVLSFALASLAIAAVFVLVAAGYGSDPVPFAWPAFSSSGLVIGGYVWLQIRGSLQSKVQTVEELNWLYERGRHRRLVRALLPLMAAVVPALLISAPNAHWSWRLAMTITPLGAWWLLGKIRRDAPSRRAEETTIDWPLWATGIPAIGYAVIPWVRQVWAEPDLRLGAAYASTLIVLIAALAGSRGATKRRLDSFDDSVEKWQQRQERDITCGASDVPPDGEGAVRP